MSKYLLNGNGKVIRSGKLVAADPDANETVLDTDKPESYTASFLIDVAKENRVAIHKKDAKKILLEKIEDSFETLNLPEHSKMTETEIVTKIVNDGVAADKSDDEMLQEIVDSGVSFKNAMKLFNAAMREGNFRISTHERNKLISTKLEELEFEPKTYEDLTNICESIVEDEGIPDTDTAQALAGVKKYLKTFKLDCPKPERAPSGGIKARIFGWISENYEEEKDNFLKFIEEISKGDEDKIERYTKSYLPVFELVQGTHAEAEG